MKLNYFFVTCVFVNVLFYGHCQSKKTTNGKLEGEITVMAGVSERGALLMTQGIFRFALPNTFKVGAGTAISFDGEKGSHPSIFLDILKLIGKKQKWSLNAQVGRAFYERFFSFSGINNTHYTTREYKEMLLQANFSYRLSLSTRTSLSIGGYFLSQSFKTFTEGTDGLGQALNPFYGRNTYNGGGLKIGLIF